MKPILLVEDDENDVFFLTKALAKAGVKNPLHVVHDGREAIDYIEGKGRFADRAAYPMPYLMLVDLKLPQVKGLDVVKRVREVVSRSVIVVVLSSSRDTRDVTEAYRCGANSYLSKPSNFDGLLELVRALDAFWLKSNIVAIAPTK